MSIQNFVVSRDDGIYEAFPALVLTEKGKLICVFTECTSHTDRSFTRIVYKESLDRGRTWGEKVPLTEGTTGLDYFYDCCSISRLKDNRLVIVTNKVFRNDDTDQGYFHESVSEMYIGTPEGEKWEGPMETPVRGLVPDTLCELTNGRWLLSSHWKSKAQGYLEQILWYTDNQGEDWFGPVTVASQEGLHLCEGSILALPDQTLVAFLRENSNQGYDGYKAISKDQGETWDGPYRMPLPGCHRPVARILKSGKVMMTHRFYQGGPTGYGSNQNLFAAWMDAETVLETDYQKQWIRVLPIDYDRSPLADNGYSGWVQFDDGEIYIVQYIADDSPNCQIRGYSLQEEEFILTTGPNLAQKPID
ncbi:sialidase family protein [Paenibacillus dokdonensis]|uniref:sialidase family protein n=1 Tax=Paenibacillus dokdonensis TaxID=2567944 RepID=UPI0010A8F692|nr:sialidase family protein [Paenibacillus dokdonensis]